MPLSIEESAVLKPFFQVLVEESQVGYVFLGQKPVCIQGFFNKDPFLVNTIVHKQSIALREGAEIGNHLKKSDSLDLESICAHLQRFKDNPEEFLPTSDNEQKLINQIHWNIYFGNVESDNSLK